MSKEKKYDYKHLVADTPTAEKLKKLAEYEGRSMKKELEMIVDIYYREFFKHEEQRDEVHKN